MLGKAVVVLSSLLLLAITISCGTHPASEQCHAKVFPRLAAIEMTGCV
jgi:hypothetical protein